MNPELDMSGRAAPGELESTAARGVFGSTPSAFATLFA